MSCLISQTNKAFRSAYRLPVEQEVQERDYGAGAASHSIGRS